MKKRYKKTVKTKNPNALKKPFLQSSNTHMAFFASGFILLLAISACSSENYSGESIRTAEVTAANKNRNLQDPEDVEDSIKNSYARLASKRSDICPKLIQEEVGSKVVERHSEVMVNNHCDYFLYPRDGQRLFVNVNNRQIEALLIVPTLHDFANGDYQVQSYDKHVIRLSYNGATYRPENLVYDVAVTVSD